MKPSTLSLREIESRLSSPDAAPTPGELAALARDPRKGARRLYERFRVQAGRRRRERERADRMFEIERRLWGRGLTRVAGVDEVGIGPMAGPVVAAAAVFPPGASLDGVDDSKRLEPAVRERLDQEIRAVACAVGIGVVEPGEVDRLNVYHAGLEAMRRAVESLAQPPEHLLVDARRVPDVSMPQDPITRGDTLSFSIAAASILAKVHRDRLMVDAERVYPGYGFARHKGYCSRQHQEAVRSLGPSPIHRRSFGFIRELTSQYPRAFYELKAGLGALDGPADLAAWRSALDRAGSPLPPEARRKLLILARRRAKRLAGDAHR